MIKDTTRTGNFTASRISELLSVGTGKTRRNYILDCALEKIGVFNTFQNTQMRHGINNQKVAFEHFKAQYDIAKGATWFDEYVPINENCGASPDVKLDDVTPMDIKCPYYLDTFLEQIAKVPNKYFYQIQMQAMALGGDSCGIGFYLTRPELTGDPEWIEYEMPLEDRLHMVTFPLSAEVEDTILKSVELAVPERELYVEILNNAPVLNIFDYFYERKVKLKKYRPIKECSNIEKAKIFKVEAEVRSESEGGYKFYYEAK